MGIKLFGNQSKAKDQLRIVLVSVGDVRNKALTCKVLTA
jgi:hypothetical protein